MSCQWLSSAAGDMRVMRLRIVAAAGQRRALVGDQPTGDRERMPHGHLGVRARPPRLRRRSYGRRPADRDGERGRRLRLGDAQLTGHPVALDVVVEAGGDDEEVIRHPGARRRDPLTDERLGQVLAGLDDIGDRLHLLGRAGRRRVGSIALDRAATGRATRTPRRRRGTAPASPIHRGRSMTSRRVGGNSVGSRSRVRVGGSSRAVGRDDDLDPLELLEVGVSGRRHRLLERADEVRRAVGDGRRSVEDRLERR